MLREITAVITTVDLLSFHVYLKTLEILNFVLREFSVLTLLDVSHLHIADSNTVESYYLVANGLEHLTDLSVTTFGNLDFNQSVALILL